MTDYPRFNEGNGLDLPFEIGPPGQTLDLSHGHLASGCVVLAAVLPVEGLGQFPGLVFRFANPDGSGFYPPMVLVCDEGQMAKVTGLVGDAVAAAIASARAANKAKP